MADPKPLSREQLAKFLPNNEAIRRFERLFAQAGDLLPTDVETLFRLSQEASIDAGLANTRAVEAHDSLQRIARSMEVMASNPQYQMPRSFSIDYIDFDENPKHAEKTRRMEWNPVDDTLNLHHTGDVTQQIGLEAYARITNTSGALIENGSTVSLSGVGGGGPVGGEKYIADGTIPSLYIVGIATQDIPDTEIGFVTVRGLVRDIDTTGTPYGETWAVNDILYASTTIAGGLTNIKPTAPNIVLPIALVITAHATTGSITCRPTVFLQLYYGAFFSDVDQTAAAVNTAYAVTFNNTAQSSGVSLGTPSSRIEAQQSGLYDFIFSVQAAKSSAAVGYIWLWLRKNGVDVANSAARVAIQGSTGEALITRSLPQSMVPGDYVELMWAVDSTATSLNADAATAFAPAAPSATMTVAQLNQ